MTMKKQAVFGMPTMQKAVYWLALWLVGFGLPASAATLNVTSYGAVSNDAGDDRASINNAITAALSGDTVYFPTGTFRISGAVIPKSGIRLEGASGAVLLYVGTSGDNLLSLYSRSNVTVTGLTLDGNNSTLVNQGIAASDGSGIRLENLTIRNLGNTGGWGPHGILFDPAVTDSAILNNTIINIATTSTWGAGIRLAHGSSRNRVENNIISNTGRGGILCNDNSTDLVIRGNTVTGSGGEGLGIELWGGCHRGLVEDNHIDHWLSLDTSDYCAVRRNTVSDKSGIYKLAGLEAISQNCVFADNVVDGGAQIGISLSNWYPKEYVLWTRNTINACGTWGAQLQGDSGGCAYQYFYQNKFLRSNSAQPPAMYANQGHGFRFNVNCHYISLEENEISNNAGDGIGPIPPDLDQMSFINNTINNNGNGSVWDGFGGDVEWEGNVVSGNRWNNNITSRGFANQKPVAAFICPSAVLPGTAVSFLNTSYDPGGSIGHVLWDFGDGLPSTDLNPTHTYANAGNYTVTLVVWDNLGRGKLVTHTLQVAYTDYYTGDLNQDYYVDLDDFLLLTTDWLHCTDLEDENCDHSWYPGPDMDWNLARDFSTETATSGLWSYGYGQSLAKEDFTLYQNRTYVGTNPVWYVDINNGPNFWKNNGSTTAYGIAPGKVSSHPSQTLLAKTRWQSSFVSTIHITGSFGAGDSGACDLWIVKDGTEILLFAEETNNEVSFNLNTSVNPGTTIDFVHGLGNGWGAENVPLNITIDAILETDCANAEAYPLYDINQDCYTNMGDMAILASQWLLCNDPANIDCTANPYFLAYWQLDETAGTSAADSVGGHLGTLKNFPADNSQWKTGKVGGALQFDGVNDYVEATGYQGITGTEPRTCAAWIKTTYGGEIVSWGLEQYSQKWIMRIQDTDGALRVEVQGGSVYGTADLRDGNWHHVAAVWADDGTPNVEDVILYIDGQRETIDTVTPYQINTGIGANVKIGVFQAATYARYFKGQTDEVRIYGKALTPSEITKLANQ